MASPYFVLTLVHQIINTFITSTGDGPLLARAHRLLQKEPTQTDNILLLVPITLGITLEILIRYIVSHVLMSILILETVKNQDNAYKLGDKKPPSSRQLLRTIDVLYRKGGLRFLFNGIGSACTYWVMHSSLVQLSSILLPSPVAYIIVSVLLAEKHFSWTAHIILPRDQVRLVPKPYDRQQWKALVIPTLIYAVANTVMVYMPALFDNSPASPDEEVAIVGLSYIVGSDVLIVGFMLFAQVFLLIPSYIVLISIQGSLLPPNCETLVFTPIKQQRGRQVKEIFSDRGPLQLQEAVQMVGVARLSWCLELYGKMCLCLVTVAAVVHAVVYSMK